MTFGERVHALERDRLVMLVTTLATPHRLNLLGRAKSQLSAFHLRLDLRSLPHHHLDISCTRKCPTVSALRASRSTLGQVLLKRIWL